MPRNDGPVDLSTQRHIASATRRAWRAETRTIDARAFLDENDTVNWDHSVLLSVVYAEYRLKRRAGEEINDEEYVRNYGEIGESLRRLIQAGRLINDENVIDDDEQWPRAGEEFADFLLVEELGRGAFARAFLAREGTMNDRHVVVKISRDVWDEASTLAQLQHTNIVPVHSVTPDDVTGFTALCMPFYGRATLADIIEQAASGTMMPTTARDFLQFAAELNAQDEAASVVKESEAIFASGQYEDAILWVGAELCDALQFAHDEGVGHGDMKPANVLIDRNGHPIVFDFNLALTDESEDGAGGTLAYMAPEQLILISDTDDVDVQRSSGAVDVYSLGVTLYEAISGRRPFDSSRADTEDNPADALLSLQRQGPPPLIGVDPEIAEAICSTLSFSPDDRPATAGDFGRQLRDLLTLRKRARRWTRRHPRIVLAAVSAVLLTLTMGTIWLATRPPYHERQYAAAEDRYRAGDFAAADEFLETALVSSPSYTTAMSLMAATQIQLGEQYRLDGNEVEALAAYGRARSLLNDVDMAQGPNPTRYLCMGYCAQQTGEISLASPFYNLAIQGGLSEPALLNNIALLDHNAKDYESALKRLNEAIESAPDSLVARYNRATLLFATAIRQRQHADSQAADDSAKHSKSVLRASRCT